MSITRKQKEQILENLKEKLKKAKVVVFGKYSGINVFETSKLRKDLLSKGIDYKIAKKTLISIAAKDLNLEVPSEEILEGPISLTIGYDDEVTPAKMLGNYAKDHENFVLTGGYMNGKLLDKKAIIELSKIPSKEELFCKFIGIISSPLRNFASGISSPLGSFARVLQQYAEKNK